ncbi:MAG TPA: sulfotransferase [Herpetosiphonaceae bacterium]
MTQDSRPDEAATTPFIFIVGVSRSGTSLMRVTLNTSDQIAICRETHFLGHLIPSEGARHKFRKFGDLADDNNVRRLVGYIYSDGFARGSKYRGISSQWRWILKHVDHDELLQRILASDRSERALFMTMLQLYAERKGRRIAGEKTPAHVRYVPTLLQWFPEGRVIHMLRDPRAIFVSELRRRSKAPVTTPYRQLKHLPQLFKLYILLQTTLVWFESVLRCRIYQQRYPRRYFVLRFEDLVRNPEGQIRRVCEFLGVDFQEAMLQQVVVSQGFEAGRAGFDAHAADRWRDYIAPWSNAWFRFWFRPYLKRFGYVNELAAVPRTGDR